MSTVGRGSVIGRLRRGARDRASAASSVTVFRRSILRTRRHGLGALTGCLGTFLVMCSQGYGAVCPTSTDGLTQVQADTVVYAASCRGWGQVFLARDTLVHSITIWRPPLPAYDPFVRRLFITEVDSGGVPLEQNRLLEGPALIVHEGDGINPVPYKFVFDPPFELPRQGLFFFDIVAAEAGDIRMLATSRNLYPDGKAWETGPTPPCVPAGVGAVTRIDLIFEIGFCGNPLTDVPLVPARR